MLVVDFSFSSFLCFYQTYTRYADFTLPLFYFSIESTNNKINTIFSFRLGYQQQQHDLILSKCSYARTSFALQHRVRFRRFFPYELKKYKNNKNKIGISICGDGCQCQSPSQFVCINATASGKRRRRLYALLTAGVVRTTKRQNDGLDWWRSNLAFRILFELVFWECDWRYGPMDQECNFQLLLPIFLIL